MRYELMRPHQIRTAIEQNWPVALALGVLEYHGEHLPVGMDALAVTRMLELVETEIDVVVLPAFHYGTAGYGVTGPTGSGSIDIEARVLHPVARQLFAGLLEAGFRNIHFFVHHQSSRFDQGMPTDLAFRLAAREAVFEFLERTRGRGWWGDASMAEHYRRHPKGADPSDWIQGHPLMTPEIIAQYPFDHAGKGETSLMMALCPETVDMARHDTTQWYGRSASEASAELGRKGRDLILERLKRVLAPRPPAPLPPPQGSA